MCSSPFLESCILYHTFSAVILTPVPRDTDSGSETDIILSLDCHKTPQLGGDSKAHVTWSSKLCLLLQVIMLNYTWVEAFCSAVFPREHKAFWHRRALTKQVLQALQEAWSCRGQVTFQPQGSACEFKTNGKQMHGVWLSVWVSFLWAKTKAKNLNIKLLGFRNKKKEKARRNKEKSEVTNLTLFSGQIRICS